MTRAASTIRQSKTLAPVLAAGAAILLLFWATRLPGIAQFPLFIDEGLHIFFSEASLQRHPFVYANKYYLVSIWWWSLFASPYGAPIWLSRVVTLLAVLPGVAAVIGIGRLAAGFWGALLGGLLYVFSTYHFFFERLAMADPMSASAALVGVYFAYRLSRRVTRLDAILAGVALFVAVGAKLSALPFLGVPIAAALTLSPRRDTPMRERLRWLMTALLVEGALVGLFVAGLIVIRRNPFANAADHVGLGEAGALGVLARIPTSAGMMLQNLYQFIGAPGLVIVVIALVVLAVRRQFYLLLCLIPPALVFLLSAMQGSRYYTAPMSMLLVCVAVALGSMVRARGRLAQSLALALVAAFGLLVWLPFAWTANTDPLHIALPQHDYAEYVQSDASGFGLADVLRVLEAEGAVRVIGVLPTCQSLRYMAYGRLTVECPTINPNGESIPALTALMESSREAGVYAVLDTIAYLPTSAPGELVATINDPSGRPRLSIYNLSP